MDNVRPIPGHRKTDLRDGDTVTIESGKIGTAVEKDGQISIEWRDPDPPPEPANRQQRRAAASAKKKGRAVHAAPISDARALEIFVENQNLKGRADIAIMNLQRFTLKARRGFSEILRLVELCAREKDGELLIAIRRLVVNALGAMPEPFKHEWRKQGEIEGCSVCGLRKEFETECPTCLGCAQAECPKCGAEQDDHDGFGVLKCLHCDYCTHPSRDNGVCGLCGDKREGSESNDVGDDGTTDRRDPEQAAGDGEGGGSRAQPASGDSPVLP